MSKAEIHARMRYGVAVQNYGNLWLTMTSVQQQAHAGNHINRRSFSGVCTANSGDSASSFVI